MNDAIALDVHTHLIPVAPERLESFDGVTWDGERMTIDGHKVGIRPIYQPERLIGWMDQNRVEHAWVSAPPPLFNPSSSGASLHPL